RLEQQRVVLVHPELIRHVKELRGNAIFRRDGSWISLIGGCINQRERSHDAEFGRLVGGQAPSVVSHRGAHSQRTIGQFHRVTKDSVAARGFSSAEQIRQ